MRAAQFLGSMRPPEITSAKQLNRMHRTSHEITPDLTQALKLLGNLSITIAVCSAKFIVLTSKSTHPYQRGRASITVLMLRLRESM